MAVYAVISPTPPYPVVNVVNFGDAVPPARDEAGNYYVPYTGNENVGEPYDLPGFITAKARADAEAALMSSDFTGKAFRALIDLTIVQLNLLRGDVIGTNTLVFDPANMANGTGVTSGGITVTGAALGDEASVMAPYTLAGIVATAYVSAANTVVIRLHNGTGAAVNLASGTWKVVVYRPVARPQLTLQQGLDAMIAKIASGGVD